MILPWDKKTTPLMLAPMQGLTNRGLRKVFAHQYRPDFMFTEFVRIQAGAKKLLTWVDYLEIAPEKNQPPLIVQLIGRDPESLGKAAAISVKEGVENLNLNLGCPFGRMTRNTAGGNLLREPLLLPSILQAIRKEVRGSFSVKCRAGFADLQEIFTLVKIFEDSGVDFLIIHPRTVQQKYAGSADHTITAELVTKTCLPVIANGDIFSARTGREVLSCTRAAGLMMGRGAISDPLLFERIRGREPDFSEPDKRAAELHYYLKALLGEFKELFHGDRQVLTKMKEVVSQIREPVFKQELKKLKRTKNTNDLVTVLEQYFPVVKLP
jgi:tRNA-dihydrouridine synthase B